MSPSFDAWFDIAEKFTRLLQQPYKRDGIQTLMAVAAKEWWDIFHWKDACEKGRRRYVKRYGVECRSGLLPRHPKKNSFHWVENFHDGSPLMEAWLPARLSPEFDPDDSPPLPIPKRTTSPAERATVLAAVWDAMWRGSKHLSIWADDDDSRVALRYWLMVRAVRKGEAIAEDAAIVVTWIEDVKSELLR
jgi:hypothetical protein